MDFWRICGLPGDMLRFVNIDQEVQSALQSHRRFPQGWGNVDGKEWLHELVSSDSE